MNKKYCKLKKRLPSGTNRLSFSRFECRQLLATDFFPAPVSFVDALLDAGTPVAAQNEVVECKVDNGSKDGSDCVDLKPIELANFYLGCDSANPSVVGPLLPVDGFVSQGVDSPAKPDPMDSESSVEDGTLLPDLEVANGYTQDRIDIRFTAESPPTEQAANQDVESSQIELAPVSMMAVSDTPEVNVAAISQPASIDSDYFASQRSQFGADFAPIGFRSGLLDNYQSFVLVADVETSEGSTTGKYDQLDRVISQYMSSMNSMPGENFFEVEVAMTETNSISRAKTSLKNWSEVEGFKRLAQSSRTNSNFDLASSERVVGSVPSVQYDQLLEIPQYFVPVDQREKNEQANDPVVSEELTESFPVADSSLLFAVLAFSLKRQRVGDDARVFRRRTF